MASSFHAIDATLSHNVTHWLIPHRFANPNEVCRSDICSDRDDDCCATGGEQGTKNEPRGCKVDGYKVTADMHGTSGWAPCRAAFGQDAIYQCCIPKSEYKETCRSDICPQLGVLRIASMA